MEFLIKFLPIVIYLLLIILLVIGIVLGIKLIGTITKVESIIDSVDKKVNSLNPIFDVINMTSFKFNRIIDRVTDFFTGIFSKLFLNGKERKEEEDE